MRSAFLVVLSVFLTACAQSTVRAPSTPDTSAQASSPSYKEIPASSSSNGYQQIRTDQDLSRLYGKRLVISPGDYKLLFKDGTLGGEISDIPLQGKWEMENGYLCTKFTAGPRSLGGGRDCQSIEINGNNIRTTGNRGKGPAVNYNIQ